MKLRLERILFTPEYTVGALYLDDCFICDTLEDTTRDLKTIKDKVPGKTAIPYGIYKVILSFSPLFKKLLPELLNVLFFSGVRIHSGNTAADSRGCILVGKYVNDGMLIDSRKTMNALMAKLMEDKDNITIEIVEA